MIWELLQSKHTHTHVYLFPLANTWQSFSMIVRFWQLIEELFLSFFLVDSMYIVRNGNFTVCSRRIPSQNHIIATNKTKQTMWDPNICCLPHWHSRKELFTRLCELLDPHPESDNVKLCRGPTLGPSQPKLSQCLSDPNVTHPNQSLSKKTLKSSQEINTAHSLLNMTW